MEAPTALAALVRLDALSYEAVGASTHELVAARFGSPEGPLPPVDGYDDFLAEAVIAVGGRDAAAFAPLVAGAVAQVAHLDETAPDDIQPNLTVLSVLNQLQVMGVDVPAPTLRTARSWLAGMQTAHVEPERWHWERGLAALALGDLATARTIAALPERGQLGFDPRADPGLNMQAWFALLVAAVEDGIDWAYLRPRWEQLLDYLPVFIEVEALAEVDLAWLGRIVHHDVAGAPLAEVADWIHAEVFRLAGLEPG